MPLPVDWSNPDITVVVVGVVPRALNDVSQGRHMPSTLFERQWLFKRRPAITGTTLPLD